MVEYLQEVCDTVIATESTNSRVMPALELSRVTGGEAVSDPVQARARALALAGEQGAVVVCGSLYLLHDLTEQLGSSPAAYGLVNVRLSPYNPEGYRWTCYSQQLQQRLQPTRCRVCTRSSTPARWWRASGFSSSS